MICDNIVVCIYLSLVIFETTNVKLLTKITVLLDFLR